MDWTKHAKKKQYSNQRPKERRLTITVTDQLEKAIGFFKSKHPDVDFTDTGVLDTFIEAGIRKFVEDQLNPTQVAPSIRYQQDHQDQDTVLSDD